MDDLVNIGLLYGKISEMTGAGVVRYTVKDEKIIFANESFVKILGLNVKPSEIEGKSLKELCKHIESPKTLWMKRDKDGIICNYEFHCMTIEGEEKWILHNSFITTDPKTKKKIVEAVLRDITAIKKVALEKERLALLAEQTNDIIGTIGVGGHLVFINRAGRKAMGLSAGDDISHTHIGELYPKFEREEIFDKAIPTAVSNGIWNGEVTILSKGIEIPASQVLVAHKNNEGGVEYLSFIIRDLSDIKEKEKGLIRLNKALTALNKCNKTISKSTNEMNLLFNLCRTIVKSGGYSVAWIGYLKDDEDKTIKPVAQAGFEKGYIESKPLTWDETKRMGYCPIINAVKEKKTVICNNILTDPKFFAIHDEAIQYNYGSHIALPIVDDKDKVFGILNIYGCDPEIFASDEAQLLKELSDNLAYRILALRAKDEADAARQETKKLIFQTLPKTSATPKK